jgi:hypothetical protein
MPETVGIALSSNATPGTVMRNVRAMKNSRGQRYADQEGGGSCSSIASAEAPILFCQCAQGGWLPRPELLGCAGLTMETSSHVD